MEFGDHYAKKNKKAYRKVKRLEPDVGHVFSTLWVRCPIQVADERIRIFLGGRPHLLLDFRIFLFVIFWTIKIFEK